MLTYRPIAAALLVACSVTPAAAQPPTSAARPLKLASWNLEVLAEQNGVGCNPRGDSDYAAMRRIANGLDADVIAFQEVENEAAAARVFDPGKFTIIMESRPGAPSSTCGGKFPEQKVTRQAVGFAVKKGIAMPEELRKQEMLMNSLHLDVSMRRTVPAARASRRWWLATLAAFAVATVATLIWNDRASPRRLMCCGLAPWMSWPSKWMRPPVGT